MCYDLQNSSHSLATQVQLMADKPICFLKDLKQELEKSYRERLGSCCYWWLDMLQEKSASLYALLRTLERRKVERHAWFKNENT